MCINMGLLATSPLHLGLQRAHLELRQELLGYIRHHDVKPLHLCVGDDAIAEYSLALVNPQPSKIKGSRVRVLIRLFKQIISPDYVCKVRRLGRRAETPMVAKQLRNSYRWSPSSVVAHQVKSNKVESFQTLNCSHEG